MCVCTQVDGRTQALLEHRLRLARLPAADAAAALLLRGLMELCIYPPRTQTTKDAAPGTAGPAGSEPPSGDGRDSHAGSGGSDDHGSASGIGAAATSATGADATPAAATAEQSSSTHAAGQLPVPWSCTDEAVLQVRLRVLISRAVCMFIAGADGVRA